MKAESLSIIKAQLPGTDWQKLQAVGLESAEHCKTRRVKILHAKLAVLMEQERLWKEQVEPHIRDEALAVRSAWDTHTSRDEALRRAQILSAQVYAYNAPPLQHYTNYHPRHWYHAQGAKTTVRPQYVEQPGRKPVMPAARNYHPPFVLTPRM